MKQAIVLGIALVLSACETPGLRSIGVPSAPAPLAKTVIDDKALRTAWQTLEVATDAITLLRQTGVIQSRTETAMKIAQGLEIAKAGLLAAEAGAKAGSTRDYLEALEQAKYGYDMMQAALRSLYNGHS